MPPNIQTLKLNTFHIRNAWIVHNNMNCTLSSPFDRYVPCFAETLYRMYSYLQTSQRVDGSGILCMSACRYVFLAGGKVNCDQFQFPKPGQIVTRQARVWMNFNPSVCRTRPHHWIGPIKSPYITGNADWIYRNSFKYYSSWRASSRIAISQLSWQTGMRKLKQRPFAAPSVLMFSCPQYITNPRWMIIVSHWRLLVGYPRLHLDGNLWLQLTIWQNGSLGINIHVPRFKSSLLLGLLLFSFLLLVFR